MNSNELAEFGAQNATKHARRQLRKQMPVAREYAYFDHAAVAPLPCSAREAIKQYATDAADHGDALWLDWSAQVEGLRKQAATLLNAQPSEIALLNNTTQGINIVAEGFPWREGENVVIPENEFPSNILPWQNLVRRGVEVRAVPVGDSTAAGDSNTEVCEVADGRVTAEMLERFIDDRTRLIALSWVGFASGFRVDIDEIVEMAHSKGVFVLLDAIQGLGAFPLDVASTGVDFVCADGHKWMLGPEGAAIFYCRQEHLVRLEPVSIGWNSLSKGAFDAKWTDDYRSRLKHDAARYEGGTTNMAGMLGFKQSLQVLMELGLNDQPSAIEASILQNVAELDAELSHAEFIVLRPDRPQNRSGIIGIQLMHRGDVLDPKQLWAARKHLLDQKIVTSVRAGRLRVATHAYNNRDDIQRLTEGLKEFRRNLL